jgi:hypothetical protein
VNPLRRLLAALTPEAEAQAARAKAVGASLKSLRSDVQAMRKEMAAVAAVAEAVTREVAQARRLEVDNRTPLALDALAGILNRDRAASHVRAAIARAPVPQGARAGLLIEQFWPDDVHEALAPAVPDAVFFDGPVWGAQTLRVPPRLAPVVSIVVWTFVAEIVRDVVVPAVAARVGVGDRVDVAPGRLVRRPPGSSAPPMALKPWHTVLIEMDLSAPRAVVVVADPGYEPPAPETGVRYTCEVRFGSRPA